MTKVFRNTNGEAVSFPAQLIHPEIDDIVEITSPSRFFAANNPADFGLTGPHEVIGRDELQYDEDTQKPSEQDDGSWTAVDLPFEQARQNKLNSFQQTYEQNMQTVREGYSESEIASWDKQEKEARAWQADNSAETPFLDVLAQARGIAKADLVAKVIAKADLATQYTAQQTGIRQALEDAIDAEAAKAEPSVAALRQITWPE